MEYGECGENFPALREASCGLLAILLNTKFCKEGANTMNLNQVKQNDLVNEALKIGGFKTKKETIDMALREFIQRRKQQEIINLFNTIEYDEDFDYKTQRQRK